jgi:energy-coupling factor transport system permease protein
MTHATSGYHVPGATWLHRRHPLTKLLGVLFVLVAAFVVPPVALAVLAIAVAAVAVSAGLGIRLLQTFRIPAILLVTMVVLNALLFPGGRDVLVSFGPLAVTREGLSFGVVSAVRLGIVFAASMLLLLSTRPDDLLEGLVAHGVSHRIAFVVLSAVQLIPRMQDRAERIRAAQAARGLATNGSLRTRVSAFVPLVGPVILGALVDVRERTLALEARGFGARPGRTAYRVVEDPTEDRAIRAGLMIATGLVVVATVVGLGR